MQSYSLLYGFQDPFGSNDVKAGKTSHTEVRLGVYQNSYSSRSHLAQFDFAYFGSKRAINNLERVIKKEFDWDIEQDGRGFSEWIWNHTNRQVEDRIDEVIEGFRFKVFKVPKQFLPLNINNLTQFEEWIDKNSQ